MKNGIKKKFIDILFEPEDDDEEEAVVERKKQPEKKAKEELSNISAKDLLYKKPETKSAFINLDEKKDKEKEKKIVADDLEGDYEFSSQISPIFGVIKESEHKKKANNSEADSKIINKPDSSHLEIITSPIYGYAKDNGEDYSNQYEYYTDEEELHELLDDVKEEDEHTYDDFSTEELNLFNYREDD